MTASEELQAKMNEAMSRTWLYDPPVDGKTPLDGSGEPRKSLINGDPEKKIAQGFTREAVGVSGEALPPEIPAQVEPAVAEKKADITRADTRAKKL